MTVLEDRKRMELELLNSVEHAQVTSQSGLARRLGIAAGLVNILMKRVVSRGLVKMQKIPARRYAYYLTPKGFTEKSRLVANYLDSSLGFFRKIRTEYQDIFNALPTQSTNSVVLVGDIELAEIALLASLDSGVKISAMICAQTNKSHLGSIPIFASLEAVPPNYFQKTVDFVLVDAKTAQYTHDLMAELHAIDHIHAPASLHISKSAEIGRNQTKTA